MYKRKNQKFKNTLKQLNIDMTQISAPQPTPFEEIPAQTPSQGEVGYLSVGVFTALGALPVKDALVTVYHSLEDGGEHVMFQSVTDESGKIPDVELPVEFTLENPDSFTSPIYYFTTYNLRVEAENYNTVKIIGFRIFPGIKTNHKIDLIPASDSEKKEQVFIIPSSPIDQSNI